MKRFLVEVEKKLNTFPKRTSAHNPEAYIGGGQSQLRYIGLRVPDLRQSLRDGFSFYAQTPEEIAKVWDHIWWNSDCYEVMSLGLTWFDLPKQYKIQSAHWPMLREWSSRIDNWAHSDSLSSIYARIHEADPAKVYPVFKKWNAAKNPWLRRLSMVSLLYYSSQRESVPSLDKILALVEPQLGHQHYYVQKGVGWTLREAGNLYPKPVYNFIEKNVTRISADAYQAATEKMSKSQREHLKSLRKKGRR